MLPGRHAQPTNPHQFAIKALSKVGLPANQLHLLELEFDLHASVSSHPNVVTFHGVIEEEDFFFVLLDYLPEGDIFDMMEIHRVYIGHDDLIKSVFCSSSMLWSTATISGSPIATSNLKTSCAKMAVVMSCWQTLV